MNEIEALAKEENVSTRTIYRRLKGNLPKRVPTHKISVRLSGANWALLKGHSNVSESVNAALEAYLA